MPTYIEGPTVRVGRFAIVAARFNGTIVDDLLAGALDGLVRHGVADEAIDRGACAGSFELPLVARKLATSGRYVAVICLGRSSAVRRALRPRAGQARPGSPARPWQRTCRWCSAC